MAIIIQKGDSGDSVIAVYNTEVTEENIGLPPDQFVYHTDLTDEQIASYNEAFAGGRLHIVDGELVEDAAPTRYVIQLSTDATDTAAPYNGIPDIPADGVSTCTITVEVMEDGATSPASGFDEDIYLSTTAGKLSPLSVTLVDGVGTSTLTSNTDTVTATIKAWSPTRGDLSDSIQIQFA